MKFLKNLAEFALASALDHYFPRKTPAAEPQVELPKFEPYVAPETVPINLDDFVLYLNSKIGDESPFRITGKVLEYGMTPQRFILTVTPENTALFTFFLDCDPAFAAVVFTIGREYFGENGLIGDSFLYRSDGTVCLSSHNDFSAVYTDYLQSTLRRARGAATGSKRNTELN